MSINKKVSSLFVVVFLVCAFVIFIIFKSKLENIQIHENRIIMTNIKKAQNIFNNYYEQINNIAYEYSTNSNILNYIQQKQLSKLKLLFENKNDFMSRLNLSYFILLDENKNRLFSKAYDLSSHEQLEVPSELLEFLKKSDLKELSTKQKYLTIDFEKAIFSIEKIVVNTQTIAYVFVARTINSDLLTKVSETIDDYASLITNFGLKNIKALTYENKKIEYAIKKLDENRMFYYLQFYDAFNDEQFYVRFLNKRQLYNSMISELKTIFYVFLIILITIMIIFFIFINKLFLKRINYLASIIKKVSLDEALKYQLKVTYNDEISYLIRRINQMFRLINAQQELNLKKERDFLQSVLDTQESIIMITDGKKIQSVNKKFKEIFSDTNHFLENIALIDNRTKANFMAVAKRYNNKDIPAKFKLINDQERYFTFQVSKLDIKKYLICMNDVSTLNYKINHLTFKASIDELTNVYNKATITNYAKKWLQERDFSIIIFDIDFFKNINDSYGHYVGDCILKELAKLISSEISENDILGRFGGEEFLLLINETSRINVLKIAQRIKKAVENKIFIIDNKQIKITISLGCTVCVFDEKFETVYKRADAALYEAKKTGRNKALFY